MLFLAALPSPFLFLSDGLVGRSLRFGTVTLVMAAVEILVMLIVLYWALLKALQQVKAGRFSLKKLSMVSLILCFMGALCTTPPTFTLLHLTLRLLDL
jgi:hypothetical protein